MKELKLEIKPLEGFGKIEFGSRPEEVVEILGEPVEEEIIEDDESDMDTLIYYYDDDGIVVYFDDSTDPVLSGFETNNPEALLFGKKIFDLSEEDIINLMKENGYDYYEVDELEDEEEPNVKWLLFDEALCDFQFEDGKLLSVSWEALYEDEFDEEE